MNDGKNAKVDIEAYTEALPDMPTSFYGELETRQIRSITVPTAARCGIGTIPSDAVFPLAVARVDDTSGLEWQIATGIERELEWTDLYGGPVLIGSRALPICIESEVVWVELGQVKKVSL